MYLRLTKYRHKTLYRCAYMPVRPHSGNFLSICLLLHDRLFFIYRLVNLSSLLQQTSRKWSLRKYKRKLQLFTFLIECREPAYTHNQHSFSIFISVINQFDAQNFCFTISLFHASTCFEHMCSSSGGQNCITQPLVSSH